MDFSVKDVYKKDKFVLRSVTRNKDFPFIRFNGNNFEELKSFITSYSSNTVIDEPGLLKEGELYTYSGRYFTLKRIPIDQLRYVIASNPYLVTENGDCIPLTLDHQQAEAYLKENRHHKLFTYNNILATYKYSPEYSSFVMYDRSHPKGMSINGLLHGYEWYIGGDDGTNRLWKLITIEKDDTLHTIDIRPSFSFSVQRIGDLIHDINNKLVLQRRALLFNESWDNLERRKILKARCHNKASFKRFVNALFHTVFRERYNESSSTTTSFGTFVNEPFIQSIETLHDYYEYGKDSFQTSVGQVFQQYLEHNQGPQDIDDYEKLQVSLLNDCYFFLKKVYDSILDEIRIEGTIGQDDQGHLYCGKALLSQNLYIYRGCKCVITSLVKNPDEKTVGKFPFYSSKLNIVTLNRTGIISKDEEGTFFVDKYILKGTVAKQLGEEVQITLVRPFVKPRGEYLGEVLDYALSGEVNKTPAGIDKPAIPVLGHGSKKERVGKKLKPMTFPMSSRPGPEPKHWLVEKYAKIADIDKKVAVALKKKVWDKLYKEVCLLKFPPKMKESSRGILCATLIFHASEKAGIAFVKVVKNERKGVDYERGENPEDYFGSPDYIEEANGTLDKAVYGMGLSIVNTAETAGLSEKESGKVYATHLPSSYKKMLNLMGVQVSQGAPEAYLKMLNYWLPEYNRLLDEKETVKNNKAEALRIAGDIGLFLDECKQKIKSVKVLMTKNQKPLTDILNKLENDLPPYFDSIK